MLKIARHPFHPAHILKRLRQAVEPVPTFFGPSAGGWIERLEDRRLLAAPDILDLAIPTPTVPVGKSLILPLAANEADGDSLTYEVISSSPNLTVQQHVGNPYLRLTVADFGVMEFEMLRDVAPQTVDTILGLVQAGFYDGLIFHRVIPNFMIQGGDPTGTGGGGPGFQFDDEFNADAIFSGRYQLAMANSGDDTNGSQFFITDASTRWLDFNHTIFGQLVRGASGVTAIANTPRGANDRPLTPVVITSAQVVQNTADEVVTLFASAAGSYPLTVRVNDGTSSVERTFAISAAVDTTNNYAFLNPLPDLATSVGQPVQFTASATDIDSVDKYFYAWVIQDGLGAINGTITQASEWGPSFTFTPKPGYTGPVDVRVGVWRTGSDWDTQVIRIAVDDEPLTEVSIPDANLLAAIRITLGKPEGPITTGDMQSLTWLYASNRGIWDLTGLEHATNLRNLDLDGNAIANLDPLAGLTNLVYLSLWNSQISDVAPLAALTNLTELTLWDNQVRDLSPLAGLTSLGYLDLEGNLVEDISVLAGLPILYGTYLSGNYLDLAPGSDDMQIIEQLLARGVWVYYRPQYGLAVWDDSGDEGDRQITLPAWDVGDAGPALSFWLNNDSPEPLEMTQLVLTGPDADQFGMRIWDANGEPVAGGSFAIAAWEQYRIEVWLNATSVGAKSAAIEFNTNFPNSAFVQLHVSGTAETPVPVYFPDANLEAAVREAFGLPEGIISVRKMSTLDELDATGRGIRDLSGLEHADNLMLLWLGDNAITDIGPLASLTELHALGLEENRIADLSPLAGMRELRWLHVGDNRITDMSIFSSLDGFETLQLFSRRIGDLSILTDLNTTYDLGIQPGTVADLAEAAARFGNLVLPPELVADLLNMMSRIVNMPQMLNFCGMAADPVALAQASAAFGMGLTTEQIDGIVAVLEQLHAVNDYGYFSRSHLDDLGKVLAAPGNMASLLLFCEKFGDEGVLTALNAAGGFGLSEQEVRNAAGGMQALAALAPHEQLLVDVASLLGRLVRPWDALNGKEELLASVEGLSAINAQYSLGLSPQQVLTLSGILGEMIDVGGDDLVADVARALMPFPNLWGLHVSENPLTDISPVASLGGLTELHLDGLQGVDVSPIFGLRGLEVLDLYGIGFTDIAALAVLPELRDLDLSGNGITDISDLVHLRKLEILEIDENQISDISVIPSLNELRYLELSDNQIADLSVFGGAAKAQALQAFSAAAGTVPILTDLNAAYGLGLEAADINDLAALMSGLGALALPPEQLAGLVSAMSRIVNLPKVLSYLSAAGNSLILATLNFQYGLGLTFTQRSGISAVFTELSAVTVSDRLFADIGTILAKPGYTASLFLAFQKFGRADLIMGVSGMAGEEITAEDAAQLAEAMQQIAALKPHEAMFVQLASVMSRITNPQKVFNFFAGISPVAILDGINNAYGMGLSPLQISLASSALADLGQLQITDRILADMGEALTVLPELYELELDENLLTGISALAGLSSLGELDVSHNRLDITPGSAAMQVIDAFLADGVAVEYRPQLVLVPSTAGPDAYYATQGPAGAELYTGSAPGGMLVQSLPLSDDPLYVIRLHAGDGADTFTFDASAGVAAAGLFQFDAGPDIDTLRIIGTEGLSLQATEDGISLDGVHWLEFINVEWVLLDSLSLNALSLFDEAWLPLAPGGRMYSVQSLTIDHTSALDIADNSLTIAADDTNRAERLSAIQQAIFAARNCGPGIFSSSAAWNQSVITTLDAGGNIVVRLALTGDATLDGYIDGDDYFALDMAFLAAGGVLVEPAADLNSDGIIDGGDFFLLDLGFLNNPVPHVQLAAGPAQSSPFSAVSIVDEVLADEGVAPVLA